MIITFLRSSSYTAFSWCNHKYFLHYVLGLDDPSGKKADLGSITHKALELLARRKFTQQKGKTTFREEEIGLSFSVAEMTPERAVQTAWDYYTPRITHHKEPWGEADRQFVRENVWNVLLYNDGVFSPLKRKVLAPEQYFDFTINEPWARYEYTLPDGRRLEGQLGLKGTLDLVTEARPGIVEYVDWKTGRRWDWINEKVKSQQCLKEDPQMRLYHYALSRLYPKLDMIFITVFFTRDGGPFSLCYHKGDLAKTEEMLRQKFNEIRSCARPKLIIGDSSQNWRCFRLCNYYKQKQEGTDKTVCQYMRDEVVQLGVDKVLAKHGRGQAYMRYGHGGGSSNRDKGGNE